MRRLRKILGAAAFAFGGVLCSSAILAGTVFYLGDRNPVHEDMDADGLSDAWEEAHGLDPTDPDDALWDVDGDGLTALEEQARAADPLNADSDGDGVADGADPVPVGAADDDDDRLPDDWERRYFKALNEDGAGDLDGDGRSNWDELRLGLDPASAERGDEAARLGVSVYTPPETL